MNVEVLLMFFSRESDSRITIDRPSVCLKTTIKNDESF